MKKRKEMTQETRNKISTSHRGLVHSEETKKKISEGLKKAHDKPGARERLREIARLRCAVITDEQKAKRYDYDMEWRARASVRFSGENGPNWQGGKTSLRDRIRRNFRARIWKTAILLRDNNRCQVCGSSKSLHVHHIINLDTLIKKYMVLLSEGDYSIPELWDTSNGVVYCKSCHAVLHGKRQSSQKQKMFLFLKRLRFSKTKLTQELEEELNELLSGLSG